MAAIIPKVRAGNQFNYLWAIERAGVAVDLTTATDVVLSYGVGKPCTDYSKIPFTVVDTNKISSSHLYGVTGTYNLKLEFKIDGEQSTIDIDAFKIVPRSEDASDSTQFAVTSDMAIGFKGEKLTFADLTPSDIAELQQPANDAIVSIQSVEEAILLDEINRVNVEKGRVTAESDRVFAENSRQNNEDARDNNENTRINAEVARQANTGTAIQNAQTATTNANTATTNANNAATLANTKAGLADTAATNANTKAGLADTAATNADNARLAIQADLGLKLDKTAVKQTTGTSETDVMSQKAVTTIADLVPALQPLQTVAGKNQYYPIIENNTGTIVGKHQTAYWNGSAWVADNSFGVGFYALQSNTGANANGMGSNALQNNTGASSNGVGNYALQNNTGVNANGMGFFALVNNTGVNANGMGYFALVSNTGANSNGVGNYALQNNTGASSNGFGGNTLAYNQKASNSAFGNYSYSDFLDNTAGNKTADSTAVDITLERITITAHGFGSTNAIVNIKYASTTGTAIGGLTVGTIYQVKIIDANTIEFVVGAVKRNLTSQGTGTHTFTPQFAYENTTCLGANTQPNKDNQVVLGSTAVDTVKMGGTARTIASATATGVKGEWCWDANYIYVCIATNTWKRIALTTW